MASPIAHRSLMATGFVRCPPLMIGYHPIISGGHLKKPVAIKFTRVMDNTTYFKVTKSDPAIARLLVAETISWSSRPLSNTDILEQLIKLRDAAYYELASEPAEEGKEDLGLDDPRPQKRISWGRGSSKLPAMVTLQAPDIEGLGLTKVPLRVLLSKPGQPLWLELKHENLQYLIQAVSKQISEGNIKRRHPRDELDQSSRVDSGVTGLTFDYTRQCFKAKKKMEGKVVATKSFKPKEAHDVDETIDEAKAWLQVVDAEEDVSQSLMQ